MELSARHRDDSASRPPSEELEVVDEREPEAATDIQGSQESETLDERGTEAATDIQSSQELEAVDERGAEALTDIERSQILKAFYKRLMAETATDRRNGSSRRKLSWPSSISAASSVGSLLLSPVA